MSVIHELPLVSTIAIGLGMAFVCGLAATKLRLSPLVGYIVAGIIVGPHSPGFIADVGIAEQLSEIGIVLLLFGVGLHFSIQDFMEVRRIASFGALTRIAIITGAGAGMATLWGWTLGPALIFGLSLSVASTVVMLRALEDHHLLASMTGKIAIGWLIVEDVAMVLAMVMIPALAAGVSTDHSSSLGMQLAIAFGKIGLFAVVMVVAGKRVLPWLLTAVSRTGSRELFTLAAISMAMGVAFGAAILFGVSLALGAFFAGMMIRESDLNHEVADRVLPFQDAFAVLFFVAVGMLFNPSILIESPGKVLATVFLIIGGKAIVTFLSVAAFRYPLRKAILVSVGLAQIGEFSFILLTVGSAALLVSEEMRSLILAGALISIALNPFLLKFAIRWCDRHAEAAGAQEGDKLATLAQEEAKKLKNLIVLVGAGRVGSYLKAMIDHNVNDVIVVEENREKVEQLRRDEDIYAIAGDATLPETLAEAQIAKANALLITLPDPFDARRIVEVAREFRPDIRIFVRSHNQEENEFFRAQNVELIVDPTEEIARRMVGGLARV